MLRRGQLGEEAAFLVQSDGDAPQTAATVYGWGVQRAEQVVDHDNVGAHIVNHLGDFPVHTDLRRRLALEQERRPNFGLPRILVQLEEPEVGVYLPGKGFTATPLCGGPYVADRERNLCRLGD